MQKWLTRTSNLTPQPVTVLAVQKDVPACYAVVVSVRTNVDFNRDGIQDFFVRMDWYVKDAFGKVTDWVVLTKLSHNAAPMMLWRK